MNRKDFLPGLNGVRTIAALMVLLHHSALGTAWFNLPTQNSNFFSALLGLLGLEKLIIWHSAGPALDMFGKKGVQLFFVLSAFLITLLLLKEKAKTETLSIRKFYLRRILRIWPLYFLLVFLSFFVIPLVPIFRVDASHAVLPQHFFRSLFFYAIFLPHLTIEAFFSAPLWSVGVEEQFYFVWPHIIKKVKEDSFFKTLLGVMLTIYLLRVANVFPDKFLRWLDFFPVGAFFAGVYHFKWSRTLRFFYHSLTQGTVLTFLLLWFFEPHLFPRLVDHLLFGLLFGTVILNVATNPRSILKLQGKGFDSLGNISYGMYCWNWVAIVPVMKFFRATWTVWGRFAEPAMYAACILGTILLASLSYFLLERPFLKLKERYQPLSSDKCAPVSSPLWGAGSFPHSVLKEY